MSAVRAVHFRDVNEVRAYRTEIYWCERLRKFVAIAVDLPACRAIGDARWQAAAGIDAVIEHYLETQRAVGNDDLINPPSRSDFQR